MNVKQIVFTQELYCLFSWVGFRFWARNHAVFCCLRFHGYFRSPDCIYFISLCWCQFYLAGNKNKFLKKCSHLLLRKNCWDIYDYFSVIFIYMSFIVMIGGAGATLQQQYRLPTLGGIGLRCGGGIFIWTE